jgi:hypothetical protein
MHASRLYFAEEIGRREMFTNKFPFVNEAITLFCCASIVSRYIPTAFELLFRCVGWQTCPLEINETVW